MTAGARVFRGGRGGGAEWAERGGGRRMRSVFGSWGRGVRRCQGGFGDASTLLDALGRELVGGRLFPPFECGSFGAIGDRADVGFHAVPNVRAHGAVGWLRVALVQYVDQFAMETRRE